DGRRGAGAVVLGSERGGQRAVAAGGATGLSSAVTGSEDEGPPAAVHDAPDAARQLLLRRGQHHGATPAVFDGGATVGRHAEAARALREAVEVEELERDARIGVGEQADE